VGCGERSGRDGGRGGRGGGGGGGGGRKRKRDQCKASCMSTNTHTLPLRPPFFLRHLPLMPRGWRQGTRGRGVGCGGDVQAASSGNGRRTENLPGADCCLPDGSPGGKRE